MEIFTHKKILGWMPIKLLKEDEIFVLGWLPQIVFDLHVLYLQPKRRGRPKAGSKKEGIQNFTRPEIRQFIKSFKKFPNPLDR